MITAFLKYKKNRDIIMMLPSKGVINPCEEVSRLVTLATTTYKATKRRRFRHMPYAPCEGGIYAVLNTVTNHCYIGSAKHFKRRKQAHFHKLRRNVHPNPHLQAAFNKYGEGVFTFEILEVVSDMAVLTKREQYYIDSRKPEYNIRLIATSNTGIKFGPRSEEFKQFMSKTLTGRKGRPRTPEERKQHSEKMKGRKMSPEALKKYSAVMKGVPKSPAARQSMSESAKRRFAKKKEAQNAGNPTLFE